MNKTGGLMAYALWIAVGFALGVWFTMTFLI